jgi:hypothetical protein
VKTARGQRGVHLNTGLRRFRQHLLAVHFEDIPMGVTTQKHGFTVRVLSAFRGYDLSLGVPILVIAVAGLVGVVLIATAPFDGPSRNNVGVGLLTGVIVGVALMGFENMLDRRREKREQEALKKRREGFLESSKISLSLLIVDYAAQLVLVLMNDDGRPDSKSQPPYWRIDDDRALVIRGLMWVAELPNQNSLWWREDRNLVACDAIITVATDLAERSMVELTDADFANFDIDVQKARRSLTVAAARLSESGDPYGAHEIDKISDSLISIPSQWAKAKLPDLGRWETEQAEILTTGGQFDYIRKIVCFTVDLLRADLKLRDVLATAPEGHLPINVQRWGILAEADKTSTSDLWQTRFADDSWMRRLLADASNNLQRMFGIKDRDREGA